MRIIKYCYAFIFIVTICAMAISGCRSYEVNSAGKDYKIFTQKKGIGQFSFEYSTRYKVLKVETADTYTDITLNNPEADEDWDISYILVFCCAIEDETPGYSDALEGYLKLCKTNKDFKLLERSSIEINGESGEEVALSYYFTLPDRPEGLSTVSTDLTIVRLVAFTHNNILWRLHVSSTESYADSAKADFEHIKQTFRILN